MRRLLREERELYEAIRNSEAFPDEVKRAVLRALPRLITQLLDLSENRNGNRVKRRVMELIRKTLRQLRHAVRHAQEHPDSNVRTGARKLVRSAQNLPLTDLAVKVSRFRGYLNKVGHQREERKRRAAREERPIGKGRKLVKDNSSGQLKKAGNVLGNCLAHPRSDYGRGYHRQLKERDADFLEFYRADKLFGILMIDRDEMYVVEALGKRNEDLELTTKEARAIQRALPEVSVDHEAFSRVGVFDEFRDGVPDPTRVVYRRTVYRIWAAKGYVILKHRRLGTRGPWTWSRFEVSRDSGERCFCDGSRHVDAMSLGRFSYLMGACPKFGATVGRALMPAQGKAARERKTKARNKKLDSLFDDLDL